jgi:hypothetical protein
MSVIEGGQFDVSAVEARVLSNVPQQRHTCLP